jgi:hypothetical protein
LQVFYSRRIGAAPLAPTGEATQQLVDVPSPATIYGAGKVVGRLGHDWTLGALSALTGANTVTVQDMASGVRSSLLVAPTTAFNVLRLKRELGGAGHVGLIGTGSTPFEGNELCPSGAPPPAGTRCFHAAYVGGVDGRWRSPSAEYVATGAFIETYLRGGQPFFAADGTLIGPGATAPGGWLRVAKEGGKHLLWSAEYTGAGRVLEYNDVGYMARQNLHAMKASIGWRTLDPGEYTFDTTTSLEVSDNRNLSGLDLGQLYELNTRLRLRNFSSIFVAADLAPARFDDREIGTPDSSLERAHYLGGRVELASDPRGLFYITLANQTQFMGAGIYSTGVQASFVLHALRQLDIELLPQLTWATGEYRYARQVSVDPSFYFGKLTAKSVSATLRATYTFTPQLTLQAYTQAFLASGHYDDVKLIMTPMMGTPPGSVTLDRLAAALASNPATTPDFEDAALNVNLVFRWEYRLGSTIYFVYTHSQIPTVPTTLFTPPGTLNPGAFGHGGSSDVVLLKVSYWWAS